MKRLFFRAFCRSMVATCLLAGCSRPDPGLPVAAPPTGRTILRMNDAGKTFLFDPGARFRIVLNSNPSTGYSWQLAGNDDGVVEAMKSSFVDNPHLPMMIGVGGKEIFPFLTLKKGTTVLRLTYRQPWKGGEADRPITFRIEVR